VLAIFNLIPVIPLDGSKILYWLLPDSLAREYDAVMSRFGIFILILLIVPFGGTSALFTLISPVINGLLNLILY
jgi:Zn-dependent protease